jgi:putative salt-induced outer membrane protein YdiY
MFTSDLFRRLQEVISSADRFLVRLKLSARRTMKKQILIVLVLVVLTVFDRARGANQTVAAPGNNPFEDSNEALTLLATAADAGAGTPGAVVSTNIITQKPVWESTIAFGLTATAGNSDSALVTGNVLTHRKTPLDEWTLGADAAYGEVASVKNNETLHGFVQYNHLFNERWYGYLRTDGLHDGIADVVYRLTLSTGAGYYFIKDKQTSLAGEAGPAVLYEKLDDEYHTYPVLRLAERYEHKFDDHARVWQNVEFLPPADSPRNFLVNAVIGVETTLTKRLSLQTYVQDNYANEPAPGFKDNDVKLVSALAVKF